MILPFLFFCQGMYRAFKPTRPAKVVTSYKDSLNYGCQKCGGTYCVCD